MLTRPPLSPFIAMPKPSPSAPRRLATGTRTSSKITWRVGCAFQPIFFSFGPKLEARGVARNDDRADALGPRLAGARHHDVHRRGAGAGDELLRAVQHVVVAVPHRGGGDGRGVGARARLGEAVAAEVLHGHEARQPAPALLGVAVGVDHPRHHVVDRDVGGDRRRRPSRAPRRSRRRRGGRGRSPRHPRPRRCRRARARRPRGGCRPGSASRRPSCAALGARAASAKSRTASTRAARSSV